MNDEWEIAKAARFDAGSSFQACVPFSSYEPIKVHIDHVADSIYEGRQLIIYRVYGKHKQWWHEIMCTNDEMYFYRKRFIDRVPQLKLINPNTNT